MKISQKLSSLSKRQLVLLSIPLFAAFASVFLLVNSFAEFNDPGYQNPPSNFRQTGSTTTTISLAWNQISPVPPGFVGYRILRNGVHLTSAGTGNYQGTDIVQGTSFTDTVGLSPGTSYTYTIRTYGSGETYPGASISASTQSPVAPPPVTPPATPPAHPPTPPATPPSSPKPTNPSTPPTVKPNPSPSPSPSLSAPDTEPPSKPGNFTAQINQGTNVSLQWDASSDNIGVDHYKLERSTDNTTFETLSDSIFVTFYTDTDTTFSTAYYYRVSAVDAASNVSEPATAQASTGTFVANAGPGQKVILSTSDGVVSISLADNTFDDPVLCTIEERLDYLPPTVKGYSTAAGPYEMTCRKADSTIVDKFNTPPQVTLAEQASWGKFGKLAYYGYVDNNWKQISGVNRDRKHHSVSFELESGMRVMTVMGKTKGSGAWWKILITILLLGGLVYGIREWLKRRKGEQAMDDYYRKSHGF